MKRMLLLLLICASAVSVSAQRDYRKDDRRERYHYKHDRQKHLGNRGEYRRQVQAINYQFDSRIHSIRENRFMGRNRKNREIRELEVQRRVALQQCRDRYFGGKRKDFARERRRGMN
jgi:hypothetical protein